MNQDATNEKIEKLFNSGLKFLDNGNYKNALNQFNKSYKLSAKVNNSKYLFESSQQIKDTAYALAVEIYNNGVHLYQNEQFAEVYDNVNAARKVANVGIQYARPFHDEQKYIELLDLINTLTTYTHQSIEYRIAKLEAESQNEEIEQEYEEEYSESEEETEENSMDDIELGYYNQAKDLFEKGDSYNDDETAINHFYRCYKIAHKHKFEELEHDSCECIARRYLSIGTKNYNKAVDDYNSGYFNDAMYGFNEAERRYKDAKEWVPGDCEDLCEEIEKNIRDASSSSYDAFTEDLYDK